MHKFKVGDRVKLVANPGCDQKIGMVGIVYKIYDNYSNDIGVDYSPHSCGKCVELNTNIELINTSPIITETITTEKIVSGSFGIINVLSTLGGSRILGVDMCQRNPTEIELREASRILLELADFMKRKGENKS